MQENAGSTDGANEDYSSESSAALLEPANSEYLSHKRISAKKLQAFPGRHQPALVRERLVATPAVDVRPRIQARRSVSMS